jgi:hypothetical protein
VASGLAASRLRTRLPGLLILGCCLVAAATLGTPGRQHLVFSDGTSRTTTGTLYSWTGWVLLAMLGVVFAVLLLVPPRLAAARASAAAVGAVVAAQLAGTGAVAVKHWGPHIGIGAPGANVGELKVLALAMALAGSLAVAACLWQLLLPDPPTADPPAPEQPKPRPATRGLLVALGLLVSLGLPWAIARGTPQMQDFTSLGAMALMFSLPWGLALALAGWLPTEAGGAMCLAVAGSVVLALAGPDMKDLMYSNPTPGFVAALVAAGLVFLVPAGGFRRPRRTAVVS